MPSTVVTATPIQPPHTTRAARRSSRPRGNTSDEEHDAADEQRERAEQHGAVDRVDHADGRAPALVGEQRRLASPSAFFSLSVAFAPTWNVNAPSTGWESAEMTRQVTT